MTHSKSSSFAKLPQVANLPKSERTLIDNKRSNSVANSQLKFVSRLKDKKFSGDDMSATKVRHKRNKVESKTSIAENVHVREDSTSKSFLYSELDDSIERRRKRHIRNEAHSLSKKYA